jgi:CBS domain-containing protein
MNHPNTNSTLANESYLMPEQMYSKKVGELAFRELITCKGSVPVFETAKIMAANKVSCIFITSESGNIDGFVTDITLRDHVIARQADVSKPIHYFMDREIRSIGTDTYVYEALLMMYQTKSRYLLVEREGAYIGFVSRNKLMSELAQSPLVFIQSVKLSRTITELKDKWSLVPYIVNQLVNKGIQAEIINQLITVIADTITQNVIEEVLKEKGEAPSKFVFMILGSEGRKEQTLKTDQDNAIIYEDKANEHREEVRKWFLEFAAEISDKLNEIGFAYCTGGFMASNPQWTHSLSHWKNNYKKWMEEALPETAIKFSTFFDCRFIYGEKSIMDELREFLDKELQQPLEKFFVYLAKNALQYVPPLTFFKPIKTITVAGREVFDIKKAMTPVVDLVRVYALRNRIFLENTGERMKALFDMGVFSEKQYQELTLSYYYLMSMRLKNQAIQILVNRTEPNNYIDIEDITRIERVTLKEIFKTIENFQAGIRIKFTNNLLG